MKIMICYDDSDEVKQCVLEARKHALAFKGEIIIVASHVSDDQHYPKRIEPVELGLKKIKAIFDDGGIPCETFIAWRGFDDDAGEHLLVVAEQNKVDEIIVGIKDRSKVGKLLLGSVAQTLLLRAECPVLGVRKNLKGYR
jgi:nucleotide-binding universal stress UspA family protein